MKRGGRVTQALESLRLIHGNREVRLLVTTQACIETAAWAFGIAFSIHAYEVGGAALVGLAVASRLAGAAAAAPFAGLLADRFGGRRLLSAAGVLAAVVLALTAAVVALDLPAAFAVFLSAVFGVCLVAFRPARSVLLPPLTRSRSHPRTAVSRVLYSHTFPGGCFRFTVRAASANRSVFLTSACS